MLENEVIKLLPADESLADQVVAYYRRNREFLAEFEPKRTEAYYTKTFQKDQLRRDRLDCEEKRVYRFYICRKEEPEKIIGSICLSNVVWGSFMSCFLGYKLDKDYVNRGYMSMALAMIVQYAFEELGLHRIEGNVMPRNLASLRVLEKNQFVNEGLSKHYLNINGVWEDHVHMVRINDAMH